MNIDILTFDGLLLIVSVKESCRGKSKEQKKIIKGINLLMEIYICYITKKM